MKQLLLIILAFISAPAATPWLQQNFENNDRTAGGKILYSNTGTACTADCMVIIDTSVARQGSKVIRSIVRKTDPICGGSLRCEGYMAKDSTRELRFFSVSFLGKNITQPDPGRVTVAQWHVWPYNEDTVYNPVLSIWLNGGRLELKQQFDSLSVNDAIPQVVRTWDLGTYENNTWYDFVIEVKFRTDPSGYIKLYKNADAQNPIPYLSITGANFNKDMGKMQRWPYYRFGLYPFDLKNQSNPVNSKYEMIYDWVNAGDATTQLSDYLLQPATTPDMPTQSLLGPWQFSNL
jgi:hypothetical protein